MSDDFSTFLLGPRIPEVMLGYCISVLLDNKTIPHWYTLGNVHLLERERARVCVQVLNIQILNWNDYWEHEGVIVSLNSSDSHTVWVQWPRFWALGVLTICWMCAVQWSHRTQTRLQHHWLHRLFCLFFFFLSSVVHKPMGLLNSVTILSIYEFIASWSVLCYFAFKHTYFSVT